LRDRGRFAASIIGKMKKSARPGAEGRVIIRNTHFENLCGTKEGFIMNGKESIFPEGARSVAESVMQTAATVEKRSCCDSPPATEPEKPSTGPLDAFQDFMRLATGKGEIDRRAKKLIAIALSVAQRCRPCLVAHMKGALSMGITRSEIEEAAALAVAFSGSPALMLYKEVCEEVYG
jgi:AhpD family alkylhydroperoxidase